MSGRAAQPAPRAPERVQTARLTLTRPVPADLPEVAGFLGDQRVGDWLGGTLDHAGAAVALSRWAAHWEVHGFGLWCARDRETGAFLGRGGLTMLVVAGRGGVEDGWAIAPDRWGEGLATELGAAGIEVAERDLGIDEVVSLTLPANTASRRVMEKLGFHYERDVDHRGLEHVLYRYGRSRTCR